MFVREPCGGFRDVTRTKKHFEWIRRQRFDIEALRQVLEDFIAEVLHTDLRVERLTEQLATAAQASDYKKPPTRSRPATPAALD